MRYFLLFSKYIFSFEFIFVAFLVAGSFKAEPVFDNLPFDLTVACAVISFLTFVFLLIRQKGIIKVNVYPILTWILFILWAFLSIFYFPATGYAVDKVLKLTILTNWSFIGAALLIAREEIRLKRTFVLMVIYSVIMALSAMKNLEAVEQQAFISVFSSSYLTLGNIVINGGIIVIISIIFCNKNLHKLLLLLFLIPLVVVTGSTGGRGPVISLLFTLFIYILVSIKIKKSKIVFNLNFVQNAILIGLALSTIATIGFTAGYFETTMDRMSLLFSDNKGDSINTRLELQVQSLSVWADNFLFGSGIGGFPTSSGIGDIREYPHNLFLEVLCELGLIGEGLLLLFLLSLMQILRTYKNMNTNQYEITLVLLLAAGFFKAMISGDLNDHRLLFATMGLLANYTSNKSVRTC